MSEYEEISTIVRSVPFGYETSARQRLIHLTKGKVVQPKQGIGRLFQRPPEETWLIDASPRRTNGVGGALTGIQVEFSSGETGHLDLTFTHVRPIPRREHDVLMAVRGHQEPQRALEARLLELLTDTVAEIPGGSPSAWRRLKSKVRDGFKRRVRDELGLDLRPQMYPAGRKGRVTHESVPWHLLLSNVDEPQLFHAELITDDDDDRLPKECPGNLASTELARAHAAVVTLCSELSLDDFTNRPTATHSQLKIVVGEALGSLARRVWKIKVVPGDEIIPREQRRVQLTLKVCCGERPVELGLDLLLRRKSADDARNFEQRSTSDFDASVRAKATEIAERRLAGEPLDVLFEKNGPPFEAIVEELSRWILTQSGYEKLHGRLELRTRRPVTRRAARLTLTLEVEPIRGRTIELELRATAGLNQESTWLRRGAPDVEETWKDELRGLARTALHTTDEAEAILSKVELEQRLRTSFEKLARRDGYEPQKLRLEWTKSVPKSARVVHISKTEQFTFSGAGTERLALTLTGRLDMVDELRYSAWPGVHEVGWAAEVVRRIGAEELSFRSRVEVRLQRDAIEAAIRTALEREAQERGYRLARFLVKGLELPSARERERKRLTVTVPLRGSGDTATWAGSVEVTLDDREGWVKAGEPDPRVQLEEWVRICLTAACRASEPGQLDTEPEVVVADFEDRMREHLRQSGYALEGLDGGIEASNAPPSSLQVEEVFECTVGPRKVDVSANVRVKLVDARQWREAKERNLEPWLRTNIRDAIGEVLLSKTFVDVLHDVVRVHRGDPAEVDVAITDALQARVEALGYDVEHVLAFPDQEAQELLTSFRIEFTQSFATSWAEREIELRVDVEGHFDDFESPDVNRLLSRGENVKDWLSQRVEQKLVMLLLDMTPDDIFFRWAKAQGDKRGELTTAVASELSTLAVVEPQIKLTPQPPPYIEKLRALCGGGPYEFQILVKERAHHDRYVYDASFSVEGLDQRGSGKLFSRTQALTSVVIQAQLERHLSSVLSARANEVTLTEDREGEFAVLFEAMDRETRDFCGNTFGLAANLVTLQRQSTKQEEVYWEERRDSADALEAEVQERRILRAGRLDMQRALMSRSTAAVRGGAALPPELSGAMPGAGTSPRTPALDAHTGQLVLASGGQASGEGTETSTVTYSGSFPSAEPECLVSVRASVAVTGSPGREVSEREIVTVVETNLQSLLVNVDPVEFWTRFDTPMPQKVRLDVRMAEAIEGALRQSHPLLKTRVSLQQEPHAQSLLLKKLLDGGDLDISQKMTSSSEDGAERPVNEIRNEIILVEVDHGRIQGRMRALFNVESAASGYWRRFECNHPDAEALRAWTRKWLAERVFQMSAESARGDVRTLLADRYRQAARERHGLEIELLEVTLDLRNHARLKQLRADIAKVEEHLRESEKFDDAPAQERREKLMARRTGLIEKLAQETNEDSIRE